MPLAAQEATIHHSATCFVLPNVPWATMLRIIRDTTTITTCHTFWIF